MIRDFSNESCKIHDNADEDNYGKLLMVKERLMVMTVTKWGMEKMLK